MAVTVKPDGTRVIDEYRAAPGVSAQALYLSLKNSGVKGVIDPGTETVAPMVNDPGEGGCPIFYGSAAYQACGAPRWKPSYNGSAYLLFDDSTGAAWPVHATVSDWNSRIRAFVVYGCNTMVTGKHCIPVYEGSYGQTNWVGRAHLEVGADNYYRDGVAWIKLNNSYSQTATGHRITVCHEIGHILGLGHNSSKTSCIYAGGGDEVSRYPNGDDISLLLTLY